VRLAMVHELCDWDIVRINAHAQTESVRVNAHA
jgi:hypothetical protein